MTKATLKKKKFIWAYSSRGISVCHGRRDSSKPQAWARSWELTFSNTSQKLRRQTGSESNYKLWKLARNDLLPPARLPLLKGPQPFPTGYPQVRTAGANTQACGGHFSFKHVYLPITDFSSSFYEYTSESVEGYCISLFTCLTNNFSVFPWSYWLSRPRCFFCQWEG